MYNKRKSSFFIYIAAVVIAVAFMYNKMLSIMVAVLFIGYKSYTSRATIIALKANRAFSQNKLEESLALFEKAYHTKGCNFSVKNTYGFVNLKYGNINKAYEIYTDLMSEKLDKNNSNMVKINLAMVLWKQGKLDEAIDMLEELYKTYKTSALYSTLGSLLIEKGSLEEAYKLILESYEYNDTDKVILDNLGQIYYLRGENQKAIETFEKLMKLNPHFPEAYFDYSKALINEGEYERALELSREALSKEFNNISTIRRDDVDEQIRLIESRIHE
jgi:tetratricopeptide (TPR) repeat protein